MAIEHKDRVKDQTSTAGTGSFVLDNISPTGFVGFLGTFSNGATVAYAIATSTNVQWEVGRGVWTAATKTLTRVPTSSSNGGALVPFTGGTKTIVSGPSAVDFNESATLTGVETLSRKTLVNPAFQGATLTDAAILSWDANLGSMAQVTIAGDRRMNPIVNLKNGPYWLFVTMGGSGNYKMTWDAVFQFDGGVVPLGSTAVGSVDAYQFIAYNNVAYSTRFVKGTAATAPATTKSILNNNFIVFGDSRLANCSQDATSFATNRTSSEGAAAYILEATNFRAVFAGNYAINSQALLDMQARLAGAAPTGSGTRGNILTVEPGKSAGIVIFLGGVNDGNTAMGTLGPIYQDIFQRLANAGKLVVVCNEISNNAFNGVQQAQLDRRSYLDNFSLPTNDSRILKANTFDLVLQPGTTNTGKTGLYFDALHLNTTGNRVLGEYIGGLLEPILSFNNYPVRNALPATQPILSASPAMGGTTGRITTETAGAGGANKDGAGGVGVTGQVADGYVFTRDTPLAALLNAAQPVAGSQLTIALSKGVDSDGFATQKFRLTGQFGLINTNYLCVLSDEEYLDKPTWATRSIPDGTQLFYKARVKVAALAKGLLGIGVGGVLYAYPDFQGDVRMLSGTTIYESGRDWRNSDLFDKVMVSPVQTVPVGYAASTINRTINNTIEISLSGGVPIDISAEVSRMSFGPEPGVAPPPVAGAIAYPFGSHLTPYVAGIAITNASQTAQDNFVRARYDGWLAGCNVPAPQGGPRARCGGWTVAIGDPQYASQNFAFFSESMGYGMLLTVLMAGYDTTAKVKFDGMFTVCRQHPAFNEGGQSSDLLDWRTDMNCASAGDGYDAMDGDMDIAMALLMADKQWGSTGTTNYKQRGINIINALKTYNMNASGYTQGLPQAQFTRCSDYMMAHFRAYKRATGDVFWDTAYSKCESFNQYVQANFSTVTGLIPENLIHCDQAHPDLSPGFTADNNAHEMDWFWNSCRVPFRLACHYVTSGDATTKTILNKMSTWLNSEMGALGVDGLSPGYKLDGTRIVARGAPGYYRSGAFSGPVMAGLTVDAAHQGQLNQLYTDATNTTEHGYYDYELSLLSLIMATGNWWNP